MTKEEIQKWISDEKDKLLSKFTIAEAIVGIKIGFEHCATLLSPQIEEQRKTIESLQKENRILRSGLRDIKNFDDELEQEWGDPGERAAYALKKANDVQNDKRSVATEDDSNNNADNQK